MKRGFILLFVLLFGVSFVLAADGWGDINSGDDGDDAPIGDDSSDGGDVASIFYEDGESLDADSKYTANFYIALGVAGVGVLIVAFFVYLFLRSPKNKWKKNSKIVKG